PHTVSGMNTHPAATDTTQLEDWDIDAAEPTADTAAASDAALMWETLTQPLDPFGLDAAAIAAEVHADDTGNAPIVLSYPIRHGRYDGITFHTALSDAADLVAALRAVADGIENGATAVRDLINKNA